MRSILLGLFLASSSSVPASPRPLDRSGPERIGSTDMRISDQDMREYRERPRASAKMRSLVSSAGRGGFSFHDTFDGQDADNMLPQEVPGAYLRQTSLTAPIFYEGDYNLAGQINTDLGAWATGNTWAGIHDNSVAISNMDGNPLNGEYNGPVGGPDPMGTRGGMLSMARASINDSLVPLGNAQRSYSINHNLYTGTPSQPLFVQVDVYKPTHEEFFWWDAISFAEGAVAMRALPGGFQDSGPFINLAQHHGDPSLIEGTVFLGPTNELDNTWLLSLKDIPEQGWYTIGLMIEPTNFLSVFIQDSETLADADMDGNPDWQMPDNPVTGLKMFEEYGLGLETGWASLLPGTLDDPATTNVIEGAGYAVNEYGQDAHVFTFQGNNVTSILACISINHSRFYSGSDPSPADLPSYEIRDWWVDNYRISGVEFPQPDPIPAYTIPYVDDMERWNVGRMSLQGGRWQHISGANPIVDMIDNHTQAPGTGEGESPSQILALPNRLVAADRFRAEMTTHVPTTPRVRGQVGDPAVCEIAYKIESAAMSYGFSAVDLSQSKSDSPEYLGRLLTSAVDSMDLADGLIYMRQRKPLGTNIAAGEFDALAPVHSVRGDNLTPDQEATFNTEYVNVLAAPDGQPSFSLSTDTWHVIRFEAEPGTLSPNGEENIVRVFVNGTELFPNGNAAENFTTSTLTADEFDISSGNNTAAGYVNLLIDDVFFDGPTQTDTLSPLDASFADDAAWEIPYVDSLDTYEKNRPATPQGFAHYRAEFIPVQDHDDNYIDQDYLTIEFIEQAGLLTDGDDVVVYEVTSIDSGSPGFSIGDIVAVPLDGLPSEYDPTHDIFGINDPMQDPTEWYTLDSVGGSQTASGTWRLNTPTGVTTFDSMIHTDMNARFSYRHNFRFTGTAAETEFVDAALEGLGAGRGDVVRMCVSDNPDPPFYGFNDQVDVFTARLPHAAPEISDDSVSLSFDIYIGQSTFSTGLWAAFDGGTSDGGMITGLSFGGNGMQSGNEVDDVVPYLPTGTFGYEIENVTRGGGNPDTLWVDSGVPITPETWYTITLEVDENSDWTITADNGGGPITIASGEAIDADNNSLVTNSLDGVRFIRNQWGDYDGNPTLGEITWTARAFDAPATATGGSDAYQFFEVDEILDSTNLPEYWPVDPITGEPDMNVHGVPTTQYIDGLTIIAIPNVNPATMMPYGAQLLNRRWRLEDDMGALRASGEWAPLGLPGAIYPDTAPAGGITAGNTPAYNNAFIYEDILLGDFVSIEPTVVLPADRWYIDNITLTADLQSNCPADLSRDGVVNGGDLAILLAAWGSPSGDISGDGNTNGSDLAILLAAWGPCPVF